MKAIVALFMAVSALASTVTASFAKADSASSKAAEDFRSRKLSEIANREAEIEVIQHALERATEARDAGRVTAVIGLLGSSLSTSMAMKVWGTERDTLCKTGLKCQAAVVGFIVTDVAMIAGGAISMTVTHEERSQILRNLHEKYRELEKMRASLESIN